MIVVILGRPGAGKTTLAKALVNHAGFMPVVNTTTRQPRGADELEYEFLPRHAFNTAVVRDEFAWVVRVHGELYATRRQELNEARSSPRTIVMTPDHEKVVRVYRLSKKHHSPFLCVYLHAEEGELRRRMQQDTERNATEEEIEQRLAESGGWYGRVRSWRDLPVIIVPEWSKEETLEYVLHVLNRYTIEGLT